MNALLPPLAGAAALLMACSAVLPSQAHAGGRHGVVHAQHAAPAHVSHSNGRHQHHRRSHGHGHRHGHGWAGLALGIGLGTLILSRPWEPVVVERPVPVYTDPTLPPVRYHAEAMPVAPRVADPVIYPSRGQSTEQIESDRQACNRWATTQRDAMADAGVFHRATLACLEGRGYTVR